MTKAEENKIERVLAENGIHLDGGFSKIPGSNLPTASAHRGSRSNSSPVIVQWNNYDAVFVYELDDELFVRFPNK